MKLNHLIIGATENCVKLNDESVIPTRTIIWSGGVAPSSLVSTLTCEHDGKGGRIVVDKYLEIPIFNRVYALGDCAFIIDPSTDNPHPTTAQHAIRQSKIVAKKSLRKLMEE